jgi:hypothetical protein
MPTKTSYVTVDRLSAVPLPNYGGRYSVVSYDNVVKQTRDQLTKHGLVIDKELYKMSLDGGKAQGIYHLKYATDPEMGLMFAWANSYNKTMRFKCAVGARVFVCDNGVISGNLGNYARKHLGTALQDVINNIDAQLVRAKEHYNNLIADKELFKQIVLSKRTQAEILGRLLIEQNILTISQIATIQRELESPTHSYNCDASSVWALYNYITLALKSSHPQYYIKDHERLHSFFMDMFGSQTNNPYLIDNQDDDDEEEVEELELEELEATLVQKQTETDESAAEGNMGVIFL